VTVADLLECLIQIKGVAGTPRRLERLAVAGLRPGSPGVSSAAEVARRLVFAEAWFQECLTLMITRDRPALPPNPLDVSDDDGTAAAEWLARFASQRADTVARLDACAAAELSRVGIEPSRGPMTVADLVAVMLAHDTDALGTLISR
jgi:hypothetical protein